MWWNIKMWWNLKIRWNIKNKFFSLLKHFINPLELPKKFVLDNWFFLRHYKCCRLFTRSTVPTTGVNACYRFLLWQEWKEHARIRYFYWMVTGARYVLFFYLNICYFYGILFENRCERRSNLDSVERSMVGENRLMIIARITFKLLYMDKINTVTRYSFEIKFLLIN